MELAMVVADLIDKVQGRLYGKYRGFVVDNQDPEHLGRLKVQVPSVFGDKVVTEWALPCLPYGGHANQGFLCIPEAKASVWVEFEKGDKDLPVWVGTFWSAPGGKSEIPTLNEADGKERKTEADDKGHKNEADGEERKNKLTPPTRKILKTQKGHTIQFEDADEEEMVTIVEATHKHVVTLNKDGIQITDGVNGHKIILGKNGIQLGSSGASEHFVLGDQFATNVASFLNVLNTHTHAPGGPPVTPPPPPPTSPPPSPPLLTLDVPLSTKHKVE